MAMVRDVWKMYNGINVVGKVERKGIPETVNTHYGVSTKVCNAFLKDESGEVRLSLWESDVERIQNGYTIKIKNGYTRLFRGVQYLSSWTVHIIGTDPDYDSENCSPAPPSELSPTAPEPDPFPVWSEKDQDIPRPNLGEIAKRERQYWREK